MKIQDMLFTGVGVLLVSKVEVLVDTRIELLDKEEREKGRLPLLPSITVSWGKKMQTRFRL